MTASAIRVDGDGITFGGVQSPSKKVLVYWAVATIDYCDLARWATAVFEAWDELGRG